MTSVLTPDAAAAAVAVVSVRQMAVVDDSGDRRVC